MGRIYKIDKISEKTGVSGERGPSRRGEALMRCRWDWEGVDSRKRTSCVPVSIARFNQSFLKKNFVPFSSPSPFLPGPGIQRPPPWPAKEAGP
jgi:hypothetical protein